MELTFYPSMALDALCYLGNHLNKYNRKVMSRGERTVYDKLDRLVGDRLKWKYLGMSQISRIISIYTENKGLEDYQLDDLITLFENIDHVGQIVRDRCNNDAYTIELLDLLKSTYAIRYIKGLQLLKEIGFEKIWENDVLPQVRKEIKRKTKKNRGLDYDSLLENIAKMKNEEKMNSVIVFVCRLSIGVSIQLYQGSYLDGFNPKPVYQLMAHELMHGFSTPELINEYLAFVKQDDYLNECHERLLKDSGSEEEFVVAAEYYLSRHLRKYNFFHLVASVSVDHSGRTPFAIIVYDYLLKEKDVPENYNEWLLRQFRNNVFPKDVKEYLKKRIPNRLPYSLFRNLGLK